MFAYQMIDLSNYNGILPPSILHPMRGDAQFLKDLQRQEDLTDLGLVRCVQTCLRNMERTLDATNSPDEELRLLLLPELCERLTPGVRTELRRISSSTAEYDPDPKRPSIFQRIILSRKPWGTACRSEATAHVHQWRQEGASLRSRIHQLAHASAESLIDRLCAAIDASAVKDRWQPNDCVYEPGFTYRVAPVVGRRVLQKTA